ncbi:suppressor of fused domain protein [Pseudomonas fluorescens]|uniref:suppressor of fused domain protein n=1 Tax=Pseudomonas fluorescens TaxID=294 RepID=UPI00123F2B6D|nr:suppressor of fused domain protein [Pseudomonas fluorescens]VVM52017.1 Antitoxin YqcF [Pseudomonas fluorescens]
MNRVPSLQRKAVVKHELSVFGKEFDINNYYNDNKTLSIELLTVTDNLDEGLVAIGTVGLSETPLLNPDGTEFITRVELCAGAPVDESHWRNIVVSTAFYIQRMEQPVMPGDVVENIIDEYFPGTNLPHVYLTAPFLWGDGSFPELTFSDLKINWLQCMAISDSEKEFIYKNGDEAFEILLSEQGVNIFDRGRASVTFK